MKQTNNLFRLCGEIFVKLAMFLLRVSQTLYCSTWVSFHPLADSDCERISCFEPTYGPTTVFFLFQAILIALEFWLGKSTTRYTANIPRPIATLLVVCMGASMAHWFSEAYVHSRFFLDSRVAYILVKRVE